MAAFLCAFSLALLFAAAAFTVLFFAGRALKNAAIIDPAWPAAVALPALGYGVLLEGWGPRKLLAVLMYVLWGARLVHYLLGRMAAHPGEDARYTELKQRWGGEADRKMFAFYMLQALAAALFSVPGLIASLNPRPGFYFLELAGFLIWAAACALEAAADRDLARFKADPANKGKTCRAGLWKYSRHPNYFSEWLVWVGIAVFALESPGGVFAFLCPALMYHFLVNVTGIPTAEAQSLKSRPEDYRHYQRTTSRFFPWFPRDVV
jgi:steroid 5-alpha reductase family enzyme